MEKFAEFCAARGERGSGHLAPISEIPSKRAERWKPEQLGSWPPPTERPSRGGREGLDLTSPRRLGR